MRKRSKKAGLILTVFLMLTIFTASAFAVEGKTIEVKGYIGEWMSEEEIQEAKADIAVTNVLEVLDAQKVDPYLDGFYKAQAPVKITVLEEGGAIFDTFKMERLGEGYVSVGDPLPVQGEIKVWEPDSTGLDYVEKILSASEAGNYDLPGYLPGCSVTLTEPGIYYTLFRYAALADACEVLIEVIGTESSTEQQGGQPQEEQPTVEDTTPAPVATAEAVPTASKVMVNGVATSFEAYNIESSNYFKLRDLAKVVNGTEKQFEVTWDGSKNAINLVSNHPYTETGEELQKGDGQTKRAVLNNSKIYKDGIEVSLTAYTINGNNYFKLRDIAATFNIGVTWDGAANTVGIDTSSDYIVK